MANTANIVDDVRTLIREADFIQVWPPEVKDRLARALQHEGDFPPFAKDAISWAMREARRIERKMARDIERGEALLPHNRKRQLVGV